MTTVARLLQVLRAGPPPRKAQAWSGVLLILAALVWLVFNLWIILLLLAGLLLGFFLVLRALRGSPPPSA
jgi:hypothetical protein